MAKRKNTEWETLKGMLQGSADVFKEDLDCSGSALYSTLKSVKLLTKDIRRRTSGVIAYVDCICRKNPVLNRDSVFKALATLEGSTMYYPDDILNKMYYQMLGAAIWILDNVRKFGKLEECCKILNEVDYELISEIEMPRIPKIGHYLYSDDIINNLATILYEIKYSESVDDKIKEYWFNIRPLIPNEEIERVNHLVDGLVEKYVFCYIEVEKYTKHPEDKDNSFQFGDLFDEVADKNSFEDFDNTSKMDAEQFSKYMMLHNSIRLHVSANNLKTLIGFRNYACMEDYFKSIYTKEIDVFGVCAAYFFYSERTCEYANVDVLPQLVCQTVFALLPWYNKNLVSNMENVVIDEKVKQAVDLSTYYSVYHPIYIQRFQDSSAEYMGNFAQYYFLQNERILPYEELPQSIIDFGVFENDVSSYFANYDKICELFKRKDDLDWVGDFSDENLNLDEEEYSDFEKEEQNTDEDDTIEEFYQENNNLEEIKTLKAQIESLKKALHTQETAYKVLEKKHEYINVEYEKNRKSLSELKEALFNRDNEQVIADEKTIDGVKLPYETKKRHIVFGGHPTWLKTIKESLKSVKFVGDNIQFSIDMIKNADIVWIQTNALSHSMYYKIIDTVRLYGVQCHYFKFSSALKCAEQLIKNDQE